MSDDRATPPGLPPSRYLIEELRSQVAEQDRRIGKMRTQQIEAFGSDGHGGFVGRMVLDFCNAQKEIVSMDKRIDMIEREATQLRTKLAFVVGGASLIAGAAVSVLTRLFGG